MSVAITSREFGRLPDGTAVVLYTLRNSGGTEVSLSSWGAIVTSVRTADRTGAVAEITLARNTLEEYLQGHPYYGALVGRVCNRISSGGFQLEGKRYDLATNLGKLHLHGGIRGFDKHLYNAEPIESSDRIGVRFTRTSPGGEEGYPGSLAVAHTITLSDDDRLTFIFDAETDATTVVNLTNHCYWNLSAEPTILDHELILNVDSVVETDQQTVPTGRFVPVNGGPFDFSRWRRIRPGFETLTERGLNGYDHSLAIRGWTEDEPATLREAASVRSMNSGRTMDVFTTYPDVHVYSGNNLVGETGRDGRELRGQEALCLECQYYPDTPNRPEFPSIILRPGERYHHVTEHRFSISP